jgi:hypothetical protein
MQYINRHHPYCVNIGTGSILSFKREMDKMILHLNSGVSSPTYIQCQIWLVRFMKDEVTKDKDKELIENLEVWEEKCDDRKDLVKCFSDWICYIRPRVLESMGCDYKKTVIIKRIDRCNSIVEEIRPLYFSVFVLDWMVRTSALLTDAQKTEWSTTVLRNWFERHEDATLFLDRAEEFFLEI